MDPTGDQESGAFRDTPGGTLIADAVDYELPLGALGTLAHVLFVRRTLERIFDYRRARVAELLGPELDAEGGQPT